MQITVKVMTEAGNDNGPESKENSDMKRSPDQQILECVSAIGGEVRAEASGLCIDEVKRIKNWR